MSQSKWRPPNLHSRAAGKRKFAVGFAILLRPAQAVDVGGLGIHVVVREDALAPRELLEKSFDFAHSAFRDDSWRLVEVKPRNGPSMSETHWSGHIPLGNARLIALRCKV